MFPFLKKLNPLKNYELNESFILAKKFILAIKLNKEHLTTKGHLRLIFYKFFCLRKAKNYIYT